MANSSFRQGHRPTTMGNQPQRDYHHHLDYHNQRAPQLPQAAATTTAVPASSFPPPTVLSLAATGASAGAYLFPQPMAVGHFGHSPYFASSVPAAILCLPLYLPFQVLQSSVPGSTTTITTANNSNNNHSPPESRYVPSYHPDYQPQPQHHQRHSQPPVPPAQHNSGHGNCQNQFRTSQTAKPGGERGVPVRHRGQPIHPVAEVPITSIDWTTPIANKSNSNNNILSSSSFGHPSRSFQPQRDTAGFQSRHSTDSFAYSTPMKKNQSTFREDNQTPSLPEREPNSTTPQTPSEITALKRKKSPTGTATSADISKGKEPWWKLPEYIPLAKSPTKSNTAKKNTEKRRPRQQQQQLIQEVVPEVIPVVETEESKMYRIRFLNCQDNTCDQAFGTRAGLQKHLLEKHGIQEHQCPMIIDDCTHSFETKEHLWAHLKAAHKGKDSWVCYACYRIFDHPLSFEEHLDLEHREGYYECTYNECKFYNYKLHPVLDHYKSVHAKLLFVIDRFSATYKQLSK